MSLNLVKLSGNGYSGIFSKLWVFGLYSLGVVPDSSW